MLKYLLKKLIYSLLSGKSHRRPPTHRPHGYYSSSDYKHRHHNHYGHGHYRGNKYYTSS